MTGRDRGCNSTILAEIGRGRKGRRVNDAKPLAGRTALITGGAKRLGRAMALALARAGADVIVHYRSSADAAGALCAELADAGVRAWSLQGDLADPASAKGLIDDAFTRCAAVDILINNASIFPSDRIDEVGLEAIRASLAVHAESPLVMTRDLAARGVRGDVVNLLDSRAVDYDAAHASYHLGKRLLLTLTRMLARELAPDIAVNGIAPGLILPPPGEDESYLRKMAHTNFLQRWGSAEEIAETALFLVTRRFVTGQVIYVDGGRHMKGHMYD
jgi:hypothetical protein